MFGVLGVVDEIPDLKPRPYQSFSIFQWNIISISAHNSSKVSVLSAYFSFHKLKLAKSYFNCKTAFDDKNLKI